MSDENKTPGDYKAPPPGATKFTRTDIQVRLTDAFVGFFPTVEGLLADIPKDKDNNRRALRAMVHLCAKFGANTLGLSASEIASACGQAGSHEANEMYAKQPKLAVIEGGADGEEEGSEEEETDETDEE